MMMTIACEYLSSQIICDYHLNQFQNEVWNVLSVDCQNAVCLTVLKKWGEGHHESITC